jgi:hypothetical protein
VGSVCREPVPFQEQDAVEVICQRARRDQSGNSGTNDNRLAADMARHRQPSGLAVGLNVLYYIAMTAKILTDAMKRVETWPEARRKSSPQSHLKSIPR